MTTHRLKIMEQFADAIVDGRKTFEVRENDRGFQPGDRVVFYDVGFNAVGGSVVFGKEHPVQCMEFEITYVLSGWWIERGYVAFSFKEVA